MVRIARYDCSFSEKEMLRARPVAYVCLGTGSCALRPSTYKGAELGKVVLLTRSHSIRPRRLTA